MRVEHARSWVRRIAAVVLATLVNLVATASAFADHTTRNEVIDESGINYFLVALVIVAAVLALGAFATAILIWERRDSDTPSS